jgi:hypothetical protein
MGTEKKIDLYKEPAAFFRERVTEVMGRQGLATLAVAEFYIVDLLTRYTQASNLFDKNPDQHTRDHEPLALMLLKAQGKNLMGVEKVTILKKLGDTSLYISGFFGDSLNRKIIDLDYYREMGAIAYRSLSAAIRDDQFQELYTELHQKFARFVDVLTEISHELKVENNQNLLRLYELYIQTGSAFAKNQLDEKGLPTPALLKNNQPKKTKN